jgi:hypothetical protein
VHVPGRNSRGVQLSCAPPRVPAALAAVSVHAVMVSHSAALQRGCCTLEALRQGGGVLACLAGPGSGGPGSGWLGARAAGSKQTAL